MLGGHVFISVVWAVKRLDSSENITGPADQRKENSTGPLVILTVMDHRTSGTFEPITVMVSMTVQQLKFKTIPSLTLIITQTHSVRA